MPSASGMHSIDCTDRYCIIGAGASGLAVAKNFVQRGIPFDCLEREPDIGGLSNYHPDESGIVYETTHLISSISSTGFDDLRMLDEDYPEYPSRRRAHLWGRFSATLCVPSGWLRTSSSAKP